MPTLVFSSVTKPSRNLLRDFDLIIQITFLSVKVIKIVGVTHHSYLTVFNMDPMCLWIDLYLHACTLLDILDRVAEESTI